MRLLTAVVCGALLVLSSPGALAAEPTPDFYDIRLSPAKPDIQRLEQLRAAHPKAAQAAREGAKSLAAARSLLSAQGARLLEAPETGVAEIVAPAPGRRVLTPPSTEPREQIARRFIEGSAPLYGLSARQAQELVTDASYANPAGNLEWVRLVQYVNGLPVFRGEVTVALTPKGEVARSMGQLAPWVVPSEARTRPLLDAADAVRIEANRVGLGLVPSDLRVLASDRDGQVVTVEAGAGNPLVRAELVYFPLGKGALELAWSMVVDAPPAAWYSLVSTVDGSVLFRKNIVDESTFSYRAYTGSSPAPFSPGPVDPTLGAQAPRVFPSLVTVIDSQVATDDPANHPWLPDGATVSDGNNVEAGLDLGGGDGVDAPLAVSAPGEFDYASNPPPGDPTPGEAPTTAASRNAAVINLFYWSNRFRDLTWDLGFTEPARNFQQDNYGRGGVGGDRVRAEAQDSSGTNNANFATPPDGLRGRMQMFVFDGPTPDRDGSLDADIVIHELAHGLSNRLHGNASGLGTQMAAGMGEGWSDFYAHSFLADPADPVLGIYTTGGYSTLQLFGAADLSNYYYGIRRFPKAVMAFTGGALDRPHNPLTFADIDSLQIDLSDGAYPPGPITGQPADQVHAAGEVWSTALWEARGELIGLHGAEAGNQRMLQLVTDGMKLNPLNPSFLDSRDSIIAADCAAYAGADETALWTAFARRGMGASAQITQVSSPARVIEAFDLPIPMVQRDSTGISNLSCSLEDRNPAPGEQLVIEVQVSSTLCGTALDNVVVGIAGGDSAVVGTLAPGTSETVELAYTVPGGAACGTSVPITIEVDSDSGPQDFAFEVPVGERVFQFSEYSNAAPITIPAGAPAATSGPASAYPANVEVAGFTGTLAGVELELHGMTHTWWADLDILLEAPNGQTLVVFSRAWNANNNADPQSVDLSLSDSAPSLLPTGGIPPGGALSFRPTAYDNDSFPVPAPAGPHPVPATMGSALLSDFAGLDPNGTWRLWINDGFGGDSGVVAGGWTLRLVEELPSVCEACLLGIGGSLSGLEPGASVVLQNNGGDDLELTSTGDFTFATPLTPGTGYEVSVLTQPDTPPQRCDVGAGSGTLGPSPVTDVAVSCRTLRQVGGNLGGLASGTSVTLRNNGGDDLVLGGDGSFAFATRIAEGDGYAVTVAQQPQAPSQTCTIVGGTGTVAGVDIDSVAVDCLIDSFLVGGTASGLLAGESVDLVMNSGTPMTVSANGPFQFPDALPDQSAWQVGIDAQSPGAQRVCRLQQSSGVLAGDDADSLVLECLPVGIFADGLED